MTDLTIIIVSFNTKALLRQCLQQVRKSQTKYSFEVWVVDNASADGSAEMVRRDFPQVRLIENQENAGYARANNQAIREITIIASASSATSPGPPRRTALPSTTADRSPGEGKYSRYILLLNSDVEISSDTFDKMLSFMDNNPTVGIAGCKVVKEDRSLDLACRRSFPNPVNAFFRFTRLSLLFPKSRIASYNLTFLPEDEIAEVDSVMGAFLLIRREVIEKIGLLDEDFFMYGEDLDFCFRAKAKGFKVMYVPITTVVHYKGSSAKKAPGRALYEFHRAMQIFYDKHYRQKYNFFVTSLVYAGIWTRYLWKSKLRK